MKSLLLTVVLLLIALTAHAQVTPVAIGAGTRLSWDQNATTLAEAQGLMYRLYKDNVQVGPLVGVVCAAPVPLVAGSFACSVAFPAGDVVGVQHALIVTAALPDGTLESPPSNTFTYVLRVVPVSPRNLKSK